MMPGMMPGMQGMGGASASGAGAAADSGPKEPTVPFSAVVASGVRVQNVKNPGGKPSQFLRFKYRTLANQMVTVVMPAELKSQKLSRNGWNTLFQVFSMDYEAKMATIAKNLPDDAASSGSTPGGMPGMPGMMPGMGGMPGMPGMGGMPLLPPMPSH